MESLFKSTIQPFFDATTPFDESRYIIFGVPFDLTSTYRRGARFAPNAIRQVSQYMETYSTRTGLDLKQISFRDMGNLTDINSVSKVLDKIKKSIGLINGANKIPIMLGGEHTITLGALRALKPELVIDFDAHLDLRHKIFGVELSHATFMRRALEENDFKIIFIGCRSPSLEELEFLENNNERIKVITSSQLLKEGPKKVIQGLNNWIVEASSAYLTIDMDVIDPASVPAVGNPSPEGITLTMLLNIISNVVNKKCLGLDFTEVTPQYDSGLSAIQAAYVVLESIYSFEANAMLT